MNPEDDVWEARALCADEGCIGVVGSDGRCKVCGLPATLQRVTPSLDLVATPAPVAPAPPQVEEVEDFDMAKRLLCPDGACTGLLGEDGRCRICGKSDR